MIQLLLLITTGTSKPGDAGECLHSTEESDKEHNGDCGSYLQDFIGFIVFAL